MEISFYKYHGAGNDFIIVDNRKNLLEWTPDFIRQLCNRRFGIGADGLMLLQQSENHDFSMRYFNADGREATMCGNGGRCIVAFAWKLGLISDETEFMAVDGIHKAMRYTDGTIALKMTDVSTVEQIGNDFFLDTGSPHYVIFVDDVDRMQVVEKGRKIRQDSSISAEGTNVNFVHVLKAGEIAVRTYERGVEDETYACGTGAVASAIGTYLYSETDIFSYTIQARGGTLSVDFKHSRVKGFYDIWLTGPVEFVFKGQIAPANSRI